MPSESSPIFSSKMQEQISSSSKQSSYNPSGAQSGATAYVSDRSAHCANRDKPFYARGIDHQIYSGSSRKSRSPKQGQLGRLHGSRNNFKRFGSFFSVRRVSSVPINILNSSGTASETTSGPRKGCRDGEEGKRLILREESRLHGTGKFSIKEVSEASKLREFHPRPTSRLPTRNWRDEVSIITRLSHALGSLERGDAENNLERVPGCSSPIRDLYFVRQATGRTNQLIGFVQDSVQDGSAIPGYSSALARGDHCLLDFNMVALPKAQ